MTTQSGYSYPRINSTDKGTGDEIVEDPFCLPDKPVKIQLEEIEKARNVIQNGIVKTDCVKSHLSEITGIDIYLKKDFLQFTGSFKDRGARYSLMMLSEEKRKSGVIVASAGNHAQAISYHGQKLGIKVTVVMPVIAPIMKIQKCRNYGAHVLVQGTGLLDARRIAIKIAKEENLTYINGYDHPQIIAAQGTCALEILDQVEDVDAVLIPTGGGGLLAGCAVALKSINPNIKVIGIEAERCDSFARALEAGAPTPTQLAQTLADGLSVGLVGYNAFESCKNLVDKMVSVSEEYLAIAILRLIELEKCVVEGSGAAPIAAILAGQLDEFIGKKIVCILTGGNIDTTVLGRCLERGLAADGRLLKIDVTVSDRPGGIAELSKLIYSIGGSIKDVIHERAWVTCDVFSVTVRVVCETRDYDHAIELRDLLSSRYNDVHFIAFPPRPKKMLIIKQNGICHN